MNRFLDKFIDSAIRTPVALAAVALITALALSPVLKADFISSWDDNAYVLSNPEIRQLTPRSVGEMFSTFHHGLYKPVTMLSFAVEYRLAGLNPKLYHFDNLLLHLTNCALVFFIGLELGMGSWTAFWLALFFGVHPMNAESVAWISERKELLHALFFLSSIYTYLRWRTSGKWQMLLLSPLLFMLALMAKPQGVVLPVALLLIDWALKRKLTLLDKIPHFIVSFFFGTLALMSTGSDLPLVMAAAQANVGLWEKICTAAHSLCGYMFRFILPINQSPIYLAPQKVGGALPFDFTFAPVAAALAALGLFYAARKERRALAGLLFFFAAIVPLLQVLPVTPSVAFDHYAYLPYLGLFCAALAAADVFLRAYPNSRGTLFKTVGAVALVFATLSFARARVWQDPTTMWGDVIAKNPRYVPAYLTRGSAYKAAGNYKEAFADYDKAVSIDGSNFYSYGNRGTIYCFTQDYPRAIADFDKALELNPNYSYAYRLRGWAYTQIRQGDKAIINFDKAIELEPFDPALHAMRADVYFSLGRFEQAIAGYTRTIQLAPNFAGAYANRGIVYLNTGRRDLALADFGKALSLEPGNATALAGKRLAGI